MKTEPIIAEGVITECLADYKFRVSVDGHHEVIAYLSGRMLKRHIVVTLGDTVVVEISPYDLSRGRVTRRF